MTGIDFLKPHWTDDLYYDGVIMNPPYKHALEFVEKSLKIAPVVCAFLRLTWLESKGRKIFFEKFPPQTVAVFSKRVPSAKNSDFENISGGPVAYAWFIWNRSHSGPTILKWI